MGSSAARAIMKREGVGKIKHLSTRVLWAQQVVKQKRASVISVASAENIADLGTKPLAGPTLTRLRWAAGLRPPSAGLCAARSLRCLALVSAAGAAEAARDNEADISMMSLGDWIMTVLAVFFLMLGGAVVNFGLRHRSLMPVVPPMRPVCHEAGTHTEKEEEPKPKEREHPRHPDGKARARCRMPRAPELCTVEEATEDGCS